MWRTLRQFFVKRSGNPTSLRLGQVQVAEKNEEVNQLSTSPESEHKPARHGKVLVCAYNPGYNYGGVNHLEDGFNLIRTIIRRAEKDEKQRIARLESFVGGEKNEENSSCGNLLDEIKLWFGGVLALSSVLSCRHFVLDDNHKIDVKKIPHVIYYVLFPKPQAALAVLPMVPRNHCQALDKSTSTDSSLNGAIASFELTSSECKAATQNKLGVKFAAMKQHQKAFALFQQASEHGHMLAQFNVGLCFEHGKGVDKNLSQAAECYQNASDLGHGGAMYNLALFYMEGGGGLPKDPNKALELLKHAAKIGMWKAQSYLGIYYADELSGHTDFAKAFTYLEQAATKKDAAAEHHLGICYERGLGVERNMSKAGQMYRAAAKHGNISSQYNLGVFYEHGLGDFSVNKDEALRYYRMAAEAGDEDAKHNYNLLKQQAAPDRLAIKPRLFSQNDLLLSLIQGLTVQRNAGVTDEDIGISRCASSPELLDSGKDLQATKCDVGNPMVAF